MRKLVLYTLSSLDGVVEEPGDRMFDVDQPVFDNLARVVAPQDTVLLGRGTYDYWVGYWPDSDVEPFASFINRTTKHVVTSTPPATEWVNSVVVDVPVVDHVTALKQEPGGDIGVHGSITLAQSLLHAGLVDEVRLVIAPTLAHRGRKLFHDGTPRRLQLLSAESTPAGNLLLGYRVASAA